MRTTALARLVVSADGRGVVSYAESRLVADLADRSSLTGRLSVGLARLARGRAVYDPGRVLVDLAVAVAVADDAECISDAATLADQHGLFGPVASDSTVWRLLSQLTDREFAEVAVARAGAREVVSAQRAEVTGVAVLAAWAACADLPGLVIDLDATLVVCHSEKEHAAATFKYYPAPPAASNATKPNVSRTDGTTATAALANHRGTAAHVRTGRN